MCENECMNEYEICIKNRESIKEMKSMRQKRMTFWETRVKVIFKEKLHSEYEFSCKISVGKETVSNAVES